jgi:hypothetical protein
MSVQEAAMETSNAPPADVIHSVDSVNGTWNLAYDQFNRLCLSNQGGYSYTWIWCGTNNTSGTQAYLYQYDRYGNRWNQTAGGAPFRLFQRVRFFLDLYPRCTGQFSPLPSLPFW